MDAKPGVGLQEVVTHFLEAFDFGLQLSGQFLWDHGSPPGSSCANAKATGACAPETHELSGRAATGQFIARGRVRPRSAVATEIAIASGAWDNFREESQTTRRHHSLHRRGADSKRSQR
jgi:hypothetical protein